MGISFESITANGQKAIFRGYLNSTPDISINRIKFSSVEKTGADGWIQWGKPAMCFDYKKFANDLKIIYGEKYFFQNNEVQDSGRCRIIYHKPF